MVNDIVKDQFFLQQKSLPAAPQDLPVVQDLVDTLRAHEHCVGIAANMIGVLRRILVFKDKQQITVMINPVVLSKTGSYEAEESCLCLSGTRKTKRFNKIKVEYLDQSFKKRIKTVQGLSAQIIQHEMDHFEGILI